MKISEFIKVQDYEKPGLALVSLTISTSLQDYEKSLLYFVFTPSR